MTAYEQRSYPGAAADTLLNADLTNVGTSFSVTPGTGTGYPDGSQGTFFVILDWDNSKAEKVRCSGRVNDTFTVAGTGGGRGQDGTSAQAHTANAKVRAVITATDIQEANRAAANTIGKVTSKGDLLAGTGANALARVGVGVDNAPLLADSSQAAGVRWDSGAWTGYSPTWGATTSGPTLGNGTITGRYKYLGAKTLVAYVHLLIGSTSTIGSGVWNFTLPAATASGANSYGQAWGNAYQGSSSKRFPIAGRVGGSVIDLSQYDGNLVQPTIPFAWVAGDQLEFTCLYETA